MLETIPPHESLIPRIEEALAESSASLGSIIDAVFLRLR
jgi:hypothetical protein